MMRARDILRVATPTAVALRTAYDAVITDVAAQHDLCSRDLREPSHLAHSSRRNAAVARWHAMSELRRRFGISYPEIGRMFGGRDHTSVMHGVREWRAMERGA